MKMIKNIVIPVDTTNGTTFKDGDLIIYNESSKTFYRTTKDNLFCREQREREEFNKKMELAILELKNKIKEMDEKYNAFLATFKETNSKLIEMVEQNILK